MVLLSAESLQKSFSEKTLFKGVSLTLHKGDRIGLIGKNGCGKSTLLQILTAKMAAESGKIAVTDGVQVTLLEQDPQPTSDCSLLEFVLAVDLPRFNAAANYTRIVNHPEVNENALQNAIELMDQFQGWSLEQDARSMLGKLGLHDLTLPARTLSGGQRKKAALVSVLLQDPQVLLLDEPTNHLDVEAIEWMEQELYRRGGTLLFTTHDRYFLDKLCTGIMELSPSGIRSYGLSYAGYLEQKAAEDQAEASMQAKYKNLYIKELDWIRRQPKARGTKAKYRVDAFDDIKEKAHSRTLNAQVKLDLSMQRQGNQVAEVQHVHKAFGSNVLIRDFSYIMKRGERIGIVGPNGVGKSTFLKLLAGLLQPDSGTIRLGSTTNIGYYEQEQTLRAKAGTRVIELVQNQAEQFKMSDGSQVSASQLLNRFLFEPARQYDSIEKLSGGELRRLQLLLVLAKGPNLLLLDEPTNDLDIQTLQVLEDFLGDFPGALVVVSHDRYFMDNLVDHLLVLEGGGLYRWFPGNYTQYRLSQEETDTRTKTESKPVQKQEIKEQAKSEGTRKRKSFKEQQEYNQLETKLVVQQKQREKLLNEMEATTDHQQLQSLADQLELLDKQIDQDELRWLELSEMD
jgi:ATP-binding cassette subfamily F protein uup